MSAHLRVHLVAAAGVDDHGLRAADDERPQAQGNAVAIVGRQTRFPERARHDPEHRAAIELEEAVRDRDQLEVAEGVARGRAEERHAPGGLLQLDQHALRHGRVDERDPRAFRARARHPVDQADTAARQVCERCVDVLDPQGHVVHARAALLDEPRDRRIGRRRLEQFQRRGPQCRKCARTRWLATSSGASTCRPRTSRKNVSVCSRSLHRDAEMVDPDLHPARTGRLAIEDVLGGRIRVHLAGGDPVDQRVELVGRQQGLLHVLEEAVGEQITQPELVSRLQAVGRASPPSVRGMPDGLPTARGRPTGRGFGLHDRRTPLALRRRPAAPGSTRST